MTRPQTRRTISVASGGHLSGAGTGMVSAAWIRDQGEYLPIDLMKG